jgi:hypothetical protein
MQIKRNNDIPLSMAEALVDLVRRFVIALDPEAKPHEAGIVRSLVPVMAGAGGISMYVGADSDAVDADEARTCLA